MLWLRSDNKGNSWTYLDGTQFPFQTFQLSQKNYLHVLISTKLCTFLNIEKPFDTTAPCNKDMDFVTFKVAENGVLWGGGTDLWYSANGGGKWVSMKMNLGNGAKITAIHIDGQRRLVVFISDNENLVLYRYKGTLPVAAEPDAPLPVSSVVLEAYPNPFRTSTTIRYTLSAPGMTKVQVFDLLGREVATVQDGFAETGTHEAQWQATNVPSGVYLMRLQTGNAVQTRRVTVLR